MGKISNLLGSRRRRLVAVTVVVLALATVWYLQRSEADESASTTTTAEATVSTIEDTVSGSGTLEPAKSSTQTFTSSGTVEKVSVAAGDTVRRGDTLATIGTTALEASLASAQAQLDAAETAAADDGDESAAQQAANTAKVASAEADVSAAQDALDAATLTAPFDGMVAEVAYEAGDQAGSSGGVAAAGAAATTTETAGITVVTPRRFVLTANVAAADVERLKTGLQAKITPAGATETIFGTVSSVGRVAETSTDGTATFPVTISVTGKQKDLYAGTSADASIVVESRDDVLTVPTAAVKTSGDRTYVTKVVDGQATRTTVTIGDTFGPTTEIVSGLQEGDTVRYTQITRRSGGSGSQGGFPGGGFPSGGQVPGGGQMPGGMPGGAAGGGR